MPRNRKKSTTSRERIDLRLIVALLLFAPIVAYILCILWLPKRYPAFISDVEIGTYVRPFINLLTPLLVAIIVFYFREPAQPDNSRKLSMTQFLIAVTFVFAYHLVVGLTFWVTVWTADYSHHDTCDETLNGRVANFVTVMNACSIFVILPIAWLFSRKPEADDANIGTIVHNNS
jgi:hypothetical protein